MLMPTSRRLLLAAALGALAASVVALTVLPGATQSPTAVPLAQRLALTDAMPMDAQIRTGTLPNGLRYYVRRNVRPENRAELRLGVNAGSLVEDDDQRGAAHFVEHMAFNGTRSFPRNELVRFMQSLGMSLGADVNASTSFDQTIYTLRLPAENPAILSRALQVLADWTHLVSFDDAEIDRERGVIVEEWRLRRGAAARLSDAVMPTLLQGSRYADRLPIGSPESIQRVSHDRLRQFYADWYRPDLMSVVAVGDFDAANVEAMIRTRFAAIPSRQNPRPRPEYAVPRQAGTRYVVVTDKEVPTARIEMTTLLPSRDPRSVGSYRQQAVDRLFAAMLSARLVELTEAATSPMLAASAGRRAFLARSVDAASLTAVVRDGGVIGGLESLLTEAARVSRFGFTAPELDRQKQALLRSYERLVAERASESASLADEYLRNFFVNEALPGVDLEYALHQRFVPEITLADVNSLAGDWFNGQHRVIAVTMPDKPGVAVPTEASLAAAVTTTASRPVSAYVAPTTTGALLATPPAAGRVVRTTPIAGAGVTEWQLSNGVRVVVKPTTFKADEVLFRAVSAGGSSLAPDDGFVPAAVAAQAVGVGGVGTHSEADLRRLLTGKAVTVVPFLSLYEHGLSGGASPKDLETLFQLIYMRFTQPRMDRNAFGVLASQARTLASTQGTTPDNVFQTTLAAILSQNHPRTQPMTPAVIDKWDLDKSLAFYKSRFADASGFTFVFVGSIDPVQLRPLAERYLGSLPSQGRRESWRDVGVRGPRGVVERQVKKGLEPKARVRVVFTGPVTYSMANLAAMRAMTLVVEGQLRTVLREMLGGTYNVTTTMNVARIPEPGYSIAIDFTSDPQRTEELVGRVFQIIAAIKTRRMPDAGVIELRNLMTREFDTNSKLNAYLLAQISARYQYGENPAELFEAPKVFQSIDAAAIQAAATQYLDTRNYVRVTLLPEK